MNRDENGRNPRKIRSYVLRAKRLSPLQSRGYDFYSHLLLQREDIVKGLNKLFQKERPIIFDIGFGTGEVTLKIAQGSPECNFIGIEVYKPGIGRLLHQAGSTGSDNIRIIEGDAEEILTDWGIPEESIYGFHIFFPDPWPKKKHHKRRLISEEFLELLEKKLVENGYIYLVTDWKNYADQIYSVLEGIPTFMKEENDLGFTRPLTKFERKGKEKQHKIYEFRYRKIKRKRIQEENI